MAVNGLRIGDGGAFGKRQPTFAQMLNRITNVEFTTVAPLLPIRCYSQYLLFP